MSESRHRRLRVSVVALVLLVVAADALYAQERGAVVGVFVGRAQNELVWTPAVPTTDANGFMLGAFLETSPPGFPIGLRAEGGLIQRGGDAVIDVGGTLTDVAIRTDYLSASLLIDIRQWLGPVEVHAAAGPTLDIILRNRLDAVLGQVFPTEKVSVAGFMYGVGAGGWVREDLYLGIDARIGKSLTDAHDGTFTSIRNRSTELVLRAGIPLSRLRNR